MKQQNQRPDPHSPPRRRPGSQTKSAFYGPGALLLIHQGIGQVSVIKEMPTEDLGDTEDKVPMGKNSL
jgi:hypothetical protein